MGICSSSEATAVAPISTAMLIFPNGELRDFARPVKAAHVLQKDAEFFICDADGMEIGGFVSAVPADAELRIGQIYFVLPRSMLRRALQADDLAALAARASSSLTRTSSGGGSPLVFTEARPTPIRRMAERRTRRRARGTGRRFEANLSMILE